MSKAAVAQHGKPLAGLPIIVGVTGHRYLRAADEPMICNAVEAIFDHLAREYPATPLVLLTPLAEGADQLVARLARRRNIPYHVPLPMPLASYREDFITPQTLAAFDALLAGAAAPSYTMPFYEDNTAETIRDPDRRALQYMLVGAHLAQACHILVALWDGQPSDKNGSTAQVVSFRLSGPLQRYFQPVSLLDASPTGAVYHVFAARGNAADAGMPGRTRLLAGRTAQSVLALQDDVATVGARDAAARASDAGIHASAADRDDPLATVYERIETFNRDCAAVPHASLAEPECTATELLQSRARRAANFYQKKIKGALLRLFLATGIAVIAFELYAHLVTQLHVLVIPYFLAALIALSTYVRARRGRWQDRAEDYRALEIGLRIQHVWNVAGVGRCAADYYMRLQRSELDWIRDAVRAAQTLDRHRAYSDAEGIAAVRSFVSEQYRYFAGNETAPGAAQREQTKTALHEKLIDASVRISVTASLGLVAFGIVATLLPAFREATEAHEIWHGSIIFVIAVSAIAAALFHDYSARRAHRQHARRYERMAQVYRQATDVLDDTARRPGPAGERTRTTIEIARAVVEELGREALGETGDWLLMHRELPIELLPLA